jgi:hypothetical protein
MFVLTRKYRHPTALTFQTASPFAWRHGHSTVIVLSFVC